METKQVTVLSKLHSKSKCNKCQKCKLQHYIRTQIFIWAAITTRMVVAAVEGARSSAPGRGRAAVAERRGEYRELSAKELGQSIAELEKKMFKHAELLEFEEAAQVRDQIEKLKSRALKSPV